MPFPLLRVVSGFWTLYSNGSTPVLSGWSVLREDSCPPPLAATSPPPLMFFHHKCCPTHSLSLVWIIHPLLLSTCLKCNLSRNLTRVAGLAARLPRSAALGRLPARQLQSEAQGPFPRSLRADPNRPLLLGVGQGGCLQLFCWASGAKARRGAVAASGGCSASPRASQSVPARRSASAGAGAARHLRPDSRVFGSGRGSRPRREELRCKPSDYPLLSLASCSLFTSSPTPWPHWTTNVCLDLRGERSGHRAHSRAEVGLGWAAVIQLRGRGGPGQEERKARQRGPDLDWEGLGARAWVNTSRSPAPGRGAAGEMLSPRPGDRRRGSSLSSSFSISTGGTATAGAAQAHCAPRSLQFPSPVCGTATVWAAAAGGALLPWTAWSSSLELLIRVGLETQSGDPVAAAASPLLSARSSPPFSPLPLPSLPASPPPPPRILAAALQTQDAGGQERAGGTAEHIFGEHRQALQR